MDKKNNKTKTHKQSELHEIRTELDAIQRHIKNIVNSGNNILKEQAGEKAGLPVKALEKQMKKNPLMTALGVFVGGIILGRIFKSCCKKR